MGLRFVLVLVGWKKVKHPQLSFFVLRKSELLTGLLQPCVRLTDPLYPVMMTCEMFFSSFYESLLTAEATDPVIANSLLSNVSSTLPSTQANLCDGPLRSDECFLALNGMARGKSPGSDRLPMEFYVKFWPILGTDLVNVLNLCYLSGVMSLTQRRGLISLTFRKGDHFDPRYWHPITLLNVD